MPTFNLDRAALDTAASVKVVLNGGQSVLLAYPCLDIPLNLPSPLSEPKQCVLAGWGSCHLWSKHMHARNLVG